MRYVRDTTGRFQERPHFDPDELDFICDRALLDHVEHCGRKLEFPISMDLLQTLIERHADTLDLYADLSAEGAGVQGVTDFFPGKRPKVRIDAGLANDAYREVRLRTTLAHEFAHVRLHNSLFQVKAEALDLFERPARRTPRAADHLARCKRETIVGAPQTDWMEWQAGYVCGALLMPRRRLNDLVQARLRAAKQFNQVDLSSTLGHQIVVETAKSFFVSEEAARVRLKVLGLAVDRPVTRSIFE
jgi:hypothetical protein